MTQYGPQKDQLKLKQAPIPATKRKTTRTKNCSVFFWGSGVHPPQIDGVFSKEASAYTGDHQASRPHAVEVATAAEPKAHATPVRE